MLEPAPLVRPHATADSLTHTAFYHVALKCPAAPDIACGSGSKPVLTDLERIAGVAGVWLHRSGTVLAVQWQPSTTATQRLALVNQVLVVNGTVGTLLAHLPREAEESLGDSKAWYDSDRLDSLTQEEADIIAHRLLHRLEARAAITHEQQFAFLEQFTHIFVRHFAVSTAALRTISGAARVAELNEEILLSSLPSFAGPLGAALATGYLPEPGDPDYSNAPVADCCTIEGL